MVATIVYTVLAKNAVFTMSSQPREPTGKAQPIQPQN